MNSYEQATQEVSDAFKALCKGRVEAAVEAERRAMMQLFTDPENQPTQHGTVTLEHMQREIAAEREACAKFFDLNDTNMFWGSQAARHIRARGQA